MPHIIKKTAQAKQFNLVGAKTNIVAQHIVKMWETNTDDQVYSTN